GSPPPGGGGGPGRAPPAAADRDTTRGAAWSTPLPGDGRAGAGLTREYARRRPDLSRKRGDLSGGEQPPEIVPFAQRLQVGVGHQHPGVANVLEVPLCQELPQQGDPPHGIVLAQRGPPARREP